MLDKWVDEDALFPCSFQKYWGKNQYSITLGFSSLALDKKSDTTGHVLIMIQKEKSKKLNK